MRSVTFFTLLQPKSTSMVAWMKDTTANKIAFQNVNVFEVSPVSLALLLLTLIILLCTVRYTVLLLIKLLRFLERPLEWNIFSGLLTLALLWFYMSNRLFCLNRTSAQLKWHQWYSSVGLVKGFAFVEFEREEDAQRACSILNSPPKNFFPNRTGKYLLNLHQRHSFRGKMTHSEVKVWSCVMAFSW